MPEHGTEAGADTTQEANVASQPMPADDDIRTALKELLKTADLQSTTGKV